MFNTIDCNGTIYCRCMDCMEDGDDHTIALADLIEDAALDAEDIALDARLDVYYGALDDIERNAAHMQHVLGMSEDYVTTWHEHQVALLSAKPGVEPVLAAYPSWGTAL